MLLDEPSSALDNQAEARLTAALRAATRDRTLLLVTHRMSMLNLVDRIIVLDKGRVIIDGPRDDIIRKLTALKGAKAPAPVQARQPQGATLGPGQAAGSPNHPDQVERMRRQMLAAAAQDAAARGAPRIVAKPAQSASSPTTDHDHQTQTTRRRSA